MKYIYHHNKNLDGLLEYYNERLEAHDGQECEGRNVKNTEKEIEVTFNDGERLVAFGSELEPVNDSEEG